MTNQTPKTHPCRPNPWCRVRRKCHLADVAAFAASTRQVKYCGFVLVAGGLGERLGYGDIKLRLPSETCTMTTYLQLYIGQILHLQERRGGEWGESEKIDVTRRDGKGLGCQDEGASAENHLLFHGVCFCFTRYMLWTAES